MGEKSDKKMCEKDQAQIEKRRRQNRESQRRYRERHRSRYTRDTPLLDVAHNTLPFETAHYWPSTVSSAHHHPAASSAPSLSTDPYATLPSSLSYPLSQYSTSVPTISPNSRNPPTTGVSSTLDAAYLDPRLMAPSTTAPGAISSLLTSTNPSGLDWNTPASSASPVSDFLTCPTTTTVYSNSTTASSYDYDFTPFPGVQHPPSPPASSSLSSPALSSTTTTTAPGQAAGAPTPSPSPGYGHNPHHSQQHLRLPHQQGLSASPPYLGLGLGMGIPALSSNTVPMGRSSSWAGSRGQTPEDSSSLPFSSGSGLNGPAASGVLSGRVARRKRSTTSTGSAPASSWTGKSLLTTPVSASGSSTSGSGVWGVDGMLPAYLAGGGAILTSDDIVAGLAVQR